MEVVSESLKFLLIGQFPSAEVRLSFPLLLESSMFPAFSMDYPLNYYI